MKRYLNLTTATFLLTTSGLALAHPGHGMTGFATGFLHPLLGWDHLLMMLAVGVWAGRLGGAMRWLLPLVFVTTMLLGSLLGANGMVVTGVESTIAAGLLAFAILLITQMKVPRAYQLIFTALFACMHGAAHGMELQQSDLLLSLTGMVCATISLHGIGYALSLQRQRFTNLVQPLLAGVMFGLGVNLLFTL